MPQFSDDLRLGPVSLPADDYLGGNPAPMSRGVGPLGRVYVFDIVPATLLANNIALSQTVAGVQTLTAGAGVTSEVGANQVSVQLVLDVPRNVRVTAAGANTAVPTITGIDQYGQRVVETLAAPSTSTVATTKTFKKIISVSMSALPGSAITVGTGDVFGLPYRISDAGYVISQKWAGAVDAGTLVTADATSPATATTDDVRGTYAPTTASNGSRRLVMVIALSGSQCGPNATRLAAAGVDQFGG